jgi:hypothetical protein
LAVVVVPAVALMIWWTAASNRYLRMPHAWAIGCSVVVLAFLLQWTLFGILDLLIGGF